MRVGELLICIGAGVSLLFAVCLRDLLHRANGHILRHLPGMCSRELLVSIWAWVCMYIVRLWILRHCPCCYITYCMSLLRGGYLLHSVRVYVCVHLPVSSWEVLN